MRCTIPITAALVLVAAPCFAQTPPAGAPRQNNAGPATTQVTQGDRGRLGLQFTEMTEDLRAFFGAPRDAGLMVSKVLPSSPAAKAGVQVGDVLVKVDASSVTDARGVREAMSAKKRGEITLLSVMRARRLIKLNTRLESDPVVEEVETGIDWHFGPGELLDPWKLERRFHWNWAWPGNNVEERLRNLERRLDELQRRLPGAPAPSKT
jgi:membrane-associated protease RseP (regulator of RpoE activity)